MKKVMLCLVALIVLMGSVTHLLAKQPQNNIINIDILIANVDRPGFGEGLYEHSVKILNQKLAPQNIKLPDDIMRKLVAMVTDKVKTIKGDFHFQATIDLEKKLIILK